MGSLPQALGKQFFRLVAEGCLDGRDDKGVGRLRVEHDDQVREAVHQAAGELLLGVELLFHLAPLRDVYQGSLVAGDAAGRVANRRRGVETSHRRTILAAQGDLPAAHRALPPQFFQLRYTLGCVQKEVRDVHRKPFSAACRAEPSGVSRNSSSLWPIISENGRSSSSAKLRLAARISPVKDRASSKS